MPKEYKKDDNMVERSDGLNVLSEYLTRLTEAINDPEKRRSYIELVEQSLRQRDCLPLNPIEFEGDRLGWEMSITRGEVKYSIKIIDENTKSKLPFSSDPEDYYIAKDTKDPNNICEQLAKTSFFDLEKYLTPIDIAEDSK